MNLVMGYHAEKSVEQKMAVLQGFTTNATKVVIATLESFGSGMDFPHVRMVFMLTMPKSVELFWQAAGRGGRDNQATSIYLFSTLHDTITACAYAAGAPDMRIVARAFGITATCRIREVLQCIGSDEAQAGCGHCDCCLRCSAMMDITAEVRAMLCDLRQRGGDATPKELKATYSVEVLRACLELGSVFTDGSSAQLRLELGTDDRTVALRRGYADAPPVVVHVTEAVCGEKRKRN